MVEYNQFVDSHMNINAGYTISKSAERKNKSNMPKPFVLGYTLNGDSKVFPLNNELAIDTAVSAIHGEVTVESFCSDTNPGLIRLNNIPVRFVVKFITSTNKDGKTTFCEKISDEYDDIISVNAFHDTHDGAFFQFVNLIQTLDLTSYQIYHEVDAKNYTDNCFVYACIPSSVFTDNEIQKLCGLMQTRSLPNKKILQIVYRIDEDRDVIHQNHSSIDTQKNRIICKQLHYSLFINVRLFVNKMSNMPQIILFGFVPNGTIYRFQFIRYHTNNHLQDHYYKARHD